MINGLFEEISEQEIMSVNGGVVVQHQIWRFCIQKWAGRLKGVV